MHVEVGLGQACIIVNFIITNVPNGKIFMKQTNYSFYNKVKSLKHLAHLFSYYFNVKQ
jgi:hypothetical protein